MIKSYEPDYCIANTSIAYSERFCTLWLAVNIANAFSKF